MRTLQEFLNTNPVENLTKSVAISERLKNDEGKLYQFKIKAMTDHEFEDLRKRSLNIRKGGKFELNLQQFNSLVVINNTVEPDFKSAENIKAVGCTTPQQYLSKVLLAGEIAELSAQIQRFSGFDTDLNDLVEEVKN